MNPVARLRHLPLLVAPLLLGLAGCRSTAVTEPPLRDALLGSWSSTLPDDDGRMILSFLRDGEVLVHLAAGGRALELPPERVSRGKWQLAGDRLHLANLQNEADWEGPVFTDASIAIQGDNLELAPLGPGKTIHALRTDWIPDPIPGNAVMRPYYETLDGNFRLEVNPARTQGMPGDRIVVRVTLTNTDARNLFVPVRLADRVILTASYLREVGPGQTVDLLLVEPPESPPLVLSAPLPPGGEASFQAVYNVPARTGRYAIKAMVFGGAGAPAEAEFEVVSGDAP